jgi:hypothetical protein
LISRFDRISIEPLRFSEGEGFMGARLDVFVVPASVAAGSPSTQALDLFVNASEFPRGVPSFTR